MPRYLTKSRFKLSLDCSAKLYFTGKKEYVDNKLEDAFMASLAEGGFQVGELAKMYYAGGTNIDELDHAKAMAITNELLKKEAVIIYEAAFQFENLFIRADIIKKIGNQLELIEVKAKSFDPAEGFTTTKGNIRPNWEPYLFDVAFQCYVICKAHPDYKVTCHLMLADKTAQASVEGLNQQFRLEKEGDRTRAVVAPGFTPELLGAPILTTVNVDTWVQEILQDKHHATPFETLVATFADAYVKDRLLPQRLGARCAQCEFKASAEQMASGLKSGFHECWRSLGGFTEEDFLKPGMLTVWDFRKKEEYLEKQKYFQEQLTREDFESRTAKKESTPYVGLSRVDRQTLQVEKSRSGDTSPFIDRVNLKLTMDLCVYPLHFIDFETTAVAIPFNNGRRPYEQIAFQFSHHTISAEGTIEHAGQWLNTEKGKFPNFDFVRALKKELEKDNSSIFRYAVHENTILNVIYRQLLESTEPDKEALCQWIQTITQSGRSSVDKWVGERNMIDLLEWVKQFYYSPLTNGSNSIKQVLPALLTENTFLQEKYREPIYGAEIRSLNFKAVPWIRFDEKGKLINPYSLLPRVHEGIENDSLDTLYTDEDSGIADGGAAMTAYARMQFTDMPERELKNMQEALLRYCELDTLAMVMIWEGFKNWCK